MNLFKSQTQLAGNGRC